MQMLLYIVQNHLRSLKDFQSREILIEIGHEKSPIEGWKNQNGAPTFSQNWTILVTNLLWKKTSRCCRHKRKDTKQFVCLLQPILQRIDSMELEKIPVEFLKNMMTNEFSFWKIGFSRWYFRSESFQRPPWWYLWTSLADLAKDYMDFHHGSWKNTSEISEKLGDWSKFTFFSALFCRENLLWKTLLEVFWWRKFSEKIKEKQ